MLENLSSLHDNFSLQEKVVENTSGYLKVSIFNIYGVSIQEEERVVMTGVNKMRFRIQENLPTGVNIIRVEDGHENSENFKLLHLEDVRQ